MRSKKKEKREEDGPASVGSEPLLMMMMTGRGIGRERWCMLALRPGLRWQNNWSGITMTTYMGLSGREDGNSAKGFVAVVGREENWGEVPFTLKRQWKAVERAD